MGLVRIFLIIIVKYYFTFHMLLDEDCSLMEYNTMLIGNVSEVHGRFIQERGGFGVSHNTKPTNSLCGERMCFKC